MSQHPPSSSREGLPDPALLQEYEYASEGAADRIITMARLEQEHRQRVEEDTLAFYRFSYRFGQTCGMTIVVAAIIACVYLTINGNETFATFLALVVFSTLAFAHVTAFFTLRGLLRPEERIRVPSKQKKHPKKKRPPQRPQRSERHAASTPGGNSGGNANRGEGQQRRRRRRSPKSKDTQKTS